MQLLSRSGTYRVLEVGSIAVVGQFLAPVAPGQMRSVLPAGGSSAGLMFFLPDLGSMLATRFCRPRSLENSYLPSTLLTASKIALLPPVTTSLVGLPLTGSVISDCSKAQSRSQTSRFMCW